MYQSHNPTDTPDLMPFIPDAKIVIADRACDMYGENYGKPIELNAETISARLRNGWVKTNAYEKNQQDIQKIADFVRNTAAETDSEEVIEVLTELADILGINLTKTYRVSLTFSFDATVELPIGSSEDDIDADNFIFELSHYDGDAELTDWDTTDTRIEYIESCD